MDSCLAKPNPDSPAGGGDMREICLNPDVKTDSKEEEDEESFLNKFLSVDSERYCFQRYLMHGRPPFHDDKRFMSSFYEPKFDFFEKLGYPIIKGRDLDGDVKHFSYSELNEITDWFSSTFALCFNLFGILYGGTIQKDSGVQNVFVKTWEYFQPFNPQVFLNPTRLHDELILLRNPHISHPNVVKLIGFHCEKRLAVLYERAPGYIQILHDIISSDAFSWNDRMKVATDMASVLKTFHENGLVHGGVNSRSIIVYEKKFPVVFDFRLFSCFEGCPELYDTYITKHYSILADYLDGPPWSMRCDIFSYGVLLLELINKRVYYRVFGYTRSNCKESAVHDSFYVDEDLALGITKLAVRCLKVKSEEQPSIQEIVTDLKDLIDRQPNKIPRISV